MCGNALLCVILFVVDRIANPYDNSISASVFRHHSMILPALCVSVSVAANVFFRQTDRAMVIGFGLLAGVVTIALGAAAQHYLLSILGAGIKLAAGAMLSIWMLHSSDSARSLFILLMVIAVALATGIVPVAGLSGIDFISLTLAMAVAYGTFFILQMTSIGDRLGQIGKVLTSGMLGLAVLVEFSTAFGYPSQLPQIVNGILFQYVFATGMVVGTIVGRMLDIERVVHAKPTRKAYIDHSQVKAPDRTMTPQQ